MPARTRKILHDDETRARIKTSQLVNRLTDHVLGAIELVPSQVTAALGLLRKTIPDLSAVNHSGQVDVRDASKVSDDALAYIAVGSGEGTPTQTDGKAIVH